jgi:multiple sugar transport system permease protein
MKSNKKNNRNKNFFRLQGKAGGFSSSSGVAYALVIPAFLLLLLVNVYPFFSGIFYSFMKGNVIKLQGYVGIQNYLKVFTMSEFANSLSFTLLFAFGGVLGSYIIGLLVALFLNIDFPLRNFVRGMFLLPWIVPPIVSIMSWRWMVGTESSMINNMLGNIGIGPILFLAEPKWAKFTVILIKVWSSIPYMAVSLLASLQTVPMDQKEAATLDGAGRFKCFWYVTWPYIKSMSIIDCILMMIWSFNDFVTIWLTTKGGPMNSTENIVVLAYKYFFLKNNIGIGATLAVVSLIIMFLISLLMLRFNREDD